MERYEKLLHDNGQGHIIKYLENATYPVYDFPSEGFIG